MKRKTFISRLTFAGGGTILLPSLALLQGCEYKPRVRQDLTEADIALLDAIGETIIPATASSPGASASKIGEYMVLMYTDCMPAEEKVVFLDGINLLDARSSEAFDRYFPDADASQRLQLLEVLQLEATAYKLKMEGTDKPLPHYFDMLKNYTVSGYFTSEIGMTQARKYLPLPGKFEACIPYNKGDRPWAT